MLGGEINRHQAQDDDMGNDTNFLMDVTRLQRPKELKFGHGLVAHGWDSRYWDKDDRRRDEDYTEEEVDRAGDGSVVKVQTPVKNRDKRSYDDQSHKVLVHQGSGLYNEAGRTELKMYEAEHEASLKSIRGSTNLHDIRNQHSEDADGREDRAVDDSDEYDDGIDLQDDQMEEGDDVGHDFERHSSATKPHIFYTGEASHVHHARNKKQNFNEKADKASAGLHNTESLSDSQHNKISENSGHATTVLSDIVWHLFILSVVSCWLPQFE